jgi:hypothetical protein
MLLSSLSSESSLLSLSSSLLSSLMLSSSSRLSSFLLLLSISDRRFRVLETVGGGGKCDCASERRVRGGGATGIPLSSSVRSALEVLILAIS